MDVALSRFGPSGKVNLAFERNVDLSKRGKRRKYPKRRNWPSDSASGAGFLLVFSFGAWNRYQPKTLNGSYPRAKLVRSVKSLISDEQVSFGWFFDL